jgi:hypothetical protein
MRVLSVFIHLFESALEEVYRVASDMLVRELIFGG